MNTEGLHKAIVKRLADNNCHVEANEITEGFQKPCFFLETTYGNIKAANKWLDNVIYTCRLQYIPKVETNYELMKCAEKLRQILMRNPIEISEDESVCIHELEFDTSLFPSLITTFEIETTEECIEEDEENEAMKNLEIGGI